jgi:hypothetical protein
MAKQRSWICDGVAKDGHAYSQGGAHDAYENFGPDCSMCGLPKEAMLSKKQKSPDGQGGGGKFPLRPVAIAAGILLACGGVVATQAERIDLLCQPLGTCLSFSDAYQKGVTQAKEAIARNQKAKTIQDVLAANDLLKSSTKNLKSVPANAKVYADALKQIAANQKVTKEIESRIAQEKQAEIAFNASQASASKAASRAKPASESFDAANQRLQGTKELWQKALDQLKPIPQNSLFAAQKQERSEAYKSKMSEIDKQIAALVPPQPVASKSTVYNPPANEPVYTEPSYSPEPAVSQPAPAYREPVQAYREPEPASNLPPVWGQGAPR